MPGFLFPPCHLGWLMRQYCVSVYLPASMEIIRSRQNPLAKHLLKLAESRRERLKQRQSLLLGTHLVDSALSAGLAPGKLVICEGKEDQPEIAALVARYGQTPVLFDRELFAAIEMSPSTVGILALVDIPPPPSPRQDGFCLLLEGVQDPGNVGSILRTAAAAGVDQVWLAPGCADAWSPKVLRAGMGAHFIVPVIERIGVEAALASFRGAIAITTLDEASSLYDSNLRGDLVLVLGSEGGGVSPELASRAGLRLRIPMQHGLESLNVAAAAAICAFERVRQLQD